MRGRPWCHISSLWDWLDSDLLCVGVYAPVLDGGSGFLLWPDLGDPAHLLGHLHTLLHCLEAGHQLGHVSAHLWHKLEEISIKLFWLTFWGSRSHSSTGFARIAALIWFSQAWHWIASFELVIYHVFLNILHNLLFRTSPGRTQCPGLLSAGRLWCCFVHANLIEMTTRPGAYRILVSAPVPVGLIRVLNWVGFGPRGFEDYGDSAWQ